MNFAISKKILIVNYSSLTALQVSNYLLPIITFPYLVRVLGPGKYGLVNFAMAFAGYFIVVVNYGFHLSATREISIARNDPETLSRKFWAVLFTKILLLVLSAPFFLLTIFLVAPFAKETGIFLLTFLLIAGAALFPDWFFQGVENMKAIAAINISAKILWTAAVFVFIRARSGAIVLILLNGLASLAIGAVGLATALMKFNLIFKPPGLKEISQTLKNGYHVFLSTLSISLYTTSNVFLLGLFAGNEAAGYFAAADKIRLAVQGLFGNAGQTIYPRTAKLFSESGEKAIAFLKKYLKIILITALPITMAMFLFARQIVTIILGKQYLTSVLPFKILLFLPLLIALSNIYGIQIMLNTGYKKDFAKIVFQAGALNLILALILIPYFQATGAATAVLAAEMFVTTAMWKFVRKKEILLRGATRLPEAA